MATAQGDTHNVNKRASYLRLNMAYNSKGYQTNLAEIEVYGTKVNDTVQKPAAIKTSNWEGSSWQKEWDKFESDETYANQKVLNEASALVGRVIGSKSVSYTHLDVYKRQAHGNRLCECCGNR